MTKFQQIYVTFYLIQYHFDRNSGFFGIISNELKVIRIESQALIIMISNE